MSASGRGALPFVMVSRRVCRPEAAGGRVTPFAVLTGTKWPHSGPASRLRISARNLAETHLSFAGMIV
jgi:hypothetical protein